MKNTLFIFFSLFFGFSILAQDDSVAEVLNPNGYSSAELQAEKRELQFQDAFIESLQEKTIENYDKALESLAICEDIFPNNVAMLFEFAKNYYALKDYTAAHTYCDKALQIEPDNFWILELSATIFVKQHNYPEAISIQKKLYQMKPSEAGDLLRLYYYARKKKEAIALINEVDKNSIYVLAIDFYKKQYKLIENDKLEVTSKPIEGVSMRETFKKKSTYSNLQVLLEADLKEQDYQALFVDSTEGLELFPAQALLYLYNGIALNSLAKHKIAIASLEEGLDYIVDNPALNKRFYRELIKAYGVLNNKQKVQVYEKKLAE